MDSTLLDQDFPLIEQDPEGFCDQYDANALEEYMERANDLYYNSDDPNHVGLSDYAYDCLTYWVTKKKKQQSVEKSKIGALPRIKNCVLLPYGMPSLNKVKLGRDVESFLQGGSVTYSLKLDGISALIIYEKGTPHQCFLRGNGVYGSDVSYILKHITLPTTTHYPNLVVRGELIVKKTIWNDTFGRASNATARNWVSGILNSGYISPYLSQIDFVAYQLVEDRDNVGDVHTMDGSLNTLSKEGFIVSKHGLLEPCLAANLLMLYKSEVEKYEYLIDGVVLSHGDMLPSLRSVSNHATDVHNPTTCVAFKINLQEQMRETIVTNVDWSFTRYGRLVPVAEFRPVFIDGARIHRATVHNASICVKKYQLGLGTKITITRSGGVIPTIVKVNEIIGTPCLPIVSYPWHWSGCDIILDDPDQCPEVILQRYVHFFETMDIPGIREGMLKKMMDGGLVTLNQIITASKERLRMISGIGPKRSESYYNDIRTGITNAHLYRLLMASNTFPSGIGKVILRQVVNAIPNVLNSCTTTELIQLNGIGKVRATKIMEGLSAFKEFSKEFPVDLSQVKHTNPSHPLISGKTFVLTGLDNDLLEDYIIDCGGRIGNKVDSETYCVIAGNILLMTE